MMTLRLSTRRRDMMVRLLVRPPTRGRTVIGVIACGLMAISLLAPGPGAGGRAAGVPSALAAAPTPLLIPPGLLPGSTGAGGEPGFHASIRALVDTEIEITGYIMPLETGESQKHFLLSPFPHNCPFCATLGPESLVEVFCARPIGMTFKAVTLKGRFNLAGFYADNGVYYRLTEAGLPTEY